MIRIKRPKSDEHAAVIRKRSSRNPSRKINQKRMIPSSTARLSLLPLFVLILFLFAKTVAAEASQYCRDGKSGATWPDDPKTTFGKLELITQGCCEFYIPSGAASPFCAEFSGNDTSLIGTEILDPNNNNKPYKILLSEGQSCTPLCGNSRSEQVNLVGRCTVSAKDKNPTDLPDTCEKACPAGKTCSQQGELERESPCIGMRFNGLETVGYKNLRRCLEVTKSLGTFAIGNSHDNAIVPNEAPFKYTCKKVTESSWGEYLPQYTCNGAGLLQPGVGLVMAILMNFVFNYMFS